MLISFVIIYIVDLMPSSGSERETSAQLSTAALTRIPDAGALIPEDLPFWGRSRIVDSVGDPISPHCTSMENHGNAMSPLLCHDEMPSIVILTML